MTLWTWLAFLVGAGIGAPLRFVIDSAVDTPEQNTWRRGTLVVNAGGSLVLGVVTALMLSDRIGEDVQIVVGVGLTGALTTFSTFAIDTVRLLDAGNVDAAIKNVALQATVTFGLATVGYAATLALA